MFSRQGIASIVIIATFFFVAAPVATADETPTDQPLSLFVEIYSFNRQFASPPGSGGGNIQAVAWSANEPAYFESITVTVDGNEINHRGTPGRSIATHRTAIPNLDDGNCHQVIIRADTNDGRWVQESITTGGCGQQLDRSASRFGTPGRFESVGSDSGGGAYHNVFLAGWPYSSLFDASYSWEPRPDRIFARDGGYVLTRAINYGEPICGSTTIDGWQHFRGHTLDVYVNVERTGHHCVPENSPPTVDAGEDDWQLPARPLIFTAVIEDRDEDDTHTATIDWGDGSEVEEAEVVGSMVMGSHRYRGAGEWNITVCVTDAAGESDCDDYIHTQRGAEGKPPEEKKPGHKKGHDKNGKR